MAHSAAPAAEHENLRNPNVSDIRDVANSMSDDDFFSSFEDSRSSDHEQHDREDPELSSEARRAADDLTLDEGEEPAEKPRKRQKPEPTQEDAPEGDEGADEAPEREEGDEEEGEEQPEDGSEPEAKEAKDAKPDRINLRDDATIVIDGHEISGAEVKRGFLRQADYTRKTQEVAQERQQVQAARQQLAAMEAELTNVLDLATDVTRNALPKAPDINQYDTSTAVGLDAYLRAQQKYQQDIKSLETVVQSKQATVQQQEAQRRAAVEAAQAEQAEREKAHLQEEFRLLNDRIPALRTRDGWNKLNSDVEKYGAAWHLTPQDVNGLKDHRMYAVLLDALEMRKLRAAKPTTIKQVQAAPPIRPAARQASGTRAADPRRSAEERFRRDPTLRNAAATLPDSLFE